MREAHEGDPKSSITKARQRLRLGQSREIESGIDRTDQVIVNPSNSVAGEDHVSGTSEQRPARREASWPVDRSRRWQGGNKSLDGADTPVMLADQLFPRGMAQLRNGEYAPPWRRIVILHAWGCHGRQDRSGATLLQRRRQSRPAHNTVCRVGQNRPAAERVNEFATPGCLHSVIKRQVLCGFGIPSFLGGLIHAATGNSGGRGATRLKRSGWARKAASRVAQRVLVSA